MAILGVVALAVWLIPFWRAYGDQLLTLTFQHLRMIGLAMPPAIALGMLLGILIARRPGAFGWILGGAGLLLTIPSIALFGAMIPALAPLGVGVGVVPAVVALVLYSQLPIIRNTYVGIREIPEPVRRAAAGMGMSRGEILRKVELPLAAPVVLTGIRTAVVLSVGVAAVAAYVGGGGLGRWIFGGIRRTYPEMMIAGALAVSLLALALDGLLALLQRALTPGGEERRS